MTELDKIRTFYRLKNVKRICTVLDRKESPAEHTWSAIVLADYFLDKMKAKMDRLRVYELLLYHDVVEIEAGDTPLRPGNNSARPDEKKALHRLKEDLPAHMRDKVISLFHEFEDKKTMEAKFARAIDQLDAEVHELDHKEDWKGWTEAFLRKHKEPALADFPELQAFFEELVAYQRKHGFFDQD